MKRPAMDYRQLRLSNLTSPRYRHVLLLLGWVAYIPLFFLSENLVSPESCTPMYCPLDDRIPFCEFFIIPYVLWYLLIIGSLAYYLLYNVELFKRMQIFIMLTQAAGLLCFVCFPTRQDLRPVEFARDNVFTQATAFLYSIDTNTGVCPSLHVAYSLAIASTWLKDKAAHWAFKLFIAVFVILVCLSTVFLKQHSVIDGLAAALMCLVFEFPVFRKYYLKNIKKRGI